MSDIPQLLSVQDVADCLGFTKEFVRQLIIRGDLEAIDMSPVNAKRKRWRIEKGSLEQYLEHRKTKNRKPEK